jgi:hypothetical protein
MGLLRILSRRGDKRVAWDLQHVDVGDPEALAAIQEAERLFNQAHAQGATAFRVERERPVERLERFDQTAEQIILVPRVVGG